MEGELDQYPQHDYSALIGFSGQLTRGLCLLPDGEEYVYAAGAHLAFNRIQERAQPFKAAAVSGATRRVGGGYTQPRNRAIGGPTNAVLESTVVSSEDMGGRARVAAEKQKAAVGGTEDNAILLPGQFIKPTLVAGHAQLISCLCLSRSGSLLISGSATSYGFKPEIIIWDVAEKRALALISQHKTSVIDIAISPDEDWFVTIGEDNWIVAHRLVEGSGFQAYQSFAGKALPSNRPCSAVAVLQDSTVVVGGDDLLCFYDLDLERRVFSENVVRLSVRRRITCFREIGSFLYAGTESGDVIKIDSARRQAVQIVPQKKPFPGAITSIVPNDQGNLIVSTTASHVYLIRADTMAPVTVNEVPAETGLRSASSANLATTVGTSSNAVTAAISAADTQKELEGVAVINSVANGVACLAVSSTGASEYCYAIGPTCLVRINKQSLECRLLQTAPPAVTCPYGIGAVCFPHDSMRVFVSTCGSFVQVWSLQTGRELLRISVPGVRALSALVSSDGGQIITGWADGCIRSHAPQTGKSLWIVENAHTDGVTALTQAAAGGYLVSGGGDGRLCLWEVRESFQRLVQVVQAHKGRVTCACAQVLDDGTEELVSTCTAGVVQLMRFTSGQRFNKQDALCDEPVKLEQCWSARAEGTLYGARELPDGSQVFCCGSAGMQWLQCGKANGSLVRALPLAVPATAMALAHSLPAGPGDTQVGKEDGEDLEKIVIGCSDGHVLIVGYDTGDILSQMKVIQGEVRCIAASDNVCLACGADGVIAGFSV